MFNDRFKCNDNDLNYDDKISIAHTKVRHTLYELACSSSCPN